MHIFLTGVSTGVDHVNGNGLDNRRENLRPVTTTQNQQNTRKRKGGTSKYKGVSWYVKKKIWRVAIRINGKDKHLGQDKDEMEAALIYIWTAKEAFGEYANAKWKGYPD
jgi:hypothetical protein